MNGGEQLDSNLRALDRMNFELTANLESQESIAQRVALLRRQLAGTSGELGVPSDNELTAALQDARTRLFSAESIEDIAAANRPTITRPARPGANSLDTKAGNTRL